jgi:hypothetical protein
MTYGNGTRADSQQLRDIQDLIAKLADVNRRLALPIRVATTSADPDQAEASAVKRL